MDISRTPRRESIGAHLLAEVYNDYIADISKKVTPQTVRNYRNNIRPACRFWDAYGEKHDYQITPETGDDLVYYLRNETQYAQNTIQTTVRRVRQFLKWLYTTGRIEIDISAWVPLPAAHRKEKRILSSAEIERLFNACIGANRVRDLAMLCFYLDTGCRLAEGASLSYKNMSWYPDMRGNAFLERVKGYRDLDKRRTVVFGPKTGKLLQLLRVIYANDPTYTSVFNLTDRGVSLAFARIRDRAGVQFTAQDLRKTFATYWTKHCNASSPLLAERLRDIQMGHSSITVADRHYVELTHEDVAEHFVSPLDGIDLFGL